MKKRCTNICISITNQAITIEIEGLPWPWSYGSWIYNNLCNQCLSPLMWVRISTRARCTTYVIFLFLWKERLFVERNKETFISENW